MAYINGKEILFSAAVNMTDGESAVHEENIRNAIIGRGGTIAADAGFADFPTAIYNIPADNAIVTVTDDTSASVKNVPANSTKYAYLVEFGGKVTEIVSNGVNLYTGKSEYELNGSTLTTTIFNKAIEGDVVLSWKIEGTIPNAAALFEITFIDGSTQNVATKYSTEFKSKDIKRVKLVNWATITGKVYDIQINLGTTALSYRPYRTPISYPIPAEIQALEGYGADGFNIDLVSQVYSYNGVSASLPTRIEPLIEVEGGGTIEFVTEYGYAVPSKMVYQTLTQ